jgi:hypothetical protein
MRKRWWAALLVAVLLPAGARAGGFGSYLYYYCSDCPPPSYSPCHYWTPALYRIHACLHGPKVSVYPPDRFPSTPPRYEITPYHCPAADPAAIPYGAHGLIPNDPSPK